jgi:hypothetical protein
VAKTCTRFIDERLDAVEELMETSAPAIKVPGLTSTYNENVYLHACIFLIGWCRE